MGVSHKWISLAKASRQLNPALCTTCFWKQFCIWSKIAVKTSEWKHLQLAQTTLALHTSEQAKMTHTIISSIINAVDKLSRPTRVIALLATYRLLICRRQVDNTAIPKSAMLFLLKFSHSICTEDALKPQYKPGPAITSPKDYFPLTFEKYLSLNFTPRWCYFRDLRRSFAMDSLHRLSRK